MKGVPFAGGRYTKGYLFLKKKRHIKRYGVGPRDRAVRHKTLLSTARI